MRWAEKFSQYWKAQPWLWDAPKVFRFPLRISLDTKQNYGEDRWLGLGLMDGRVVVIVFSEPKP